MCTVTFLPLQNNNFILTSNRDEQRIRETIPPKKYKENGVDLFFPKDKIAGGTWIGTSSNKRLVCVLNGAFKKHKRKDYYKKSRQLEKTPSSYPAVTLALSKKKGTHAGTVSKNILKRMEECKKKIIPDGV